MALRFGTTTGNQCIALSCGPKVGFEDGIPWQGTDSLPVQGFDVGGGQLSLDYVVCGLQPLLLRVLEYLGQA